MIGIVKTAGCQQKQLHDLYSIVVHGKVLSIISYRTCPLYPKFELPPQGNATENPQQGKASRMVVLSQMQSMCLTLYHKLKYPVHQMYE